MPSPTPAAVPTDAAAPPPAARPATPATPAASSEAWDRMVTSELRTATGRPDLTLPPGACDTRPCRMLLRPPRDLVGLALSGGGNRSATFNLGMLQGLHDLKLLPAFDYLATVSGGGYVGGFWSAWRARRPRGRAFPGGGTYEGRAEAPEIRHLRQFSNFLSPRVSLLSWDTGRMIAAAVSGLVPAFAAALSLLVLGLATWLFAAWRLAEGAGAPGAFGPGVRAAALLGLLLGVTEWLWRRREPDRAAAWSYVYSAAGGVLAGALAWALLTRHWLPAATAPAVPWARVPDDPALLVGGVPVDAALVVAPVAACAIAAAAIAVVRMLFSTRRPVTARVRDVRAAAERVLARLLLGGALWAVVGGLWIGGVALADATRGSAAGGAAPAGAAGALALLATVFTRVLRVMSLLPKGRTDGSRARRLIPLTPQVLAYVIIAGVSVLLASALTAAHRAPAFDLSAVHDGLVLPAACAAYTAAVVVLLLTWRFFDPNTVGLHAFYRARLARAYLGASNERAGREYAASRRVDADRYLADDAGGRQSEEQDDDDVLLTDLAGQRPVHLVCCAANDLAPRDPVANLRRGARSAVLSAHGYGVGDAAAEWARDASRGAAPGARPDLRGPLPPESLGTAMTASAAAFNSQMGIQSVRFGPAVTFLLSALNLRLGLWLPHPDGARRAAGPLMRQPGAKFFCEITGRTSAEGSSVHLSDGAHFENLAVYELVRRQCRYILVSDCGADPDVAFDDFGTLVRRVRQDFGVEIDLDLAPLRPGPDGRAAQHMVAGDVHYPTGDVGVLLYVKPTLAGGEPPDVTQYHTRNPAFPHESTGDQFYDEAQWESYRRLGVHTARAAFFDVVQRLGADADPECGPSHEAAARVFASARQQWLPTPPGFAERASQLAERCSRLDEALHASAAAGDAGPAAERPMVRGVYWELASVADTPGAPLAALERALPLVREALLEMEELYNTEPIDRSRHPVYVGTLNYFARWANLPATRFWWPMLRALHAPGFVAYAERQFGLSGTGGARGPRYRVSEREFGAGGHTHVERCWLQSGRPAPGPGDTCVQLAAALSWGEGAVEVAVAQLVVRDLAMRTAAGRRERVAVFDADWLYVPPGLWGAGAGSALLAMCGERRDDVLSWASGLLVRVPLAPRFGLASWREHAAAAQLFRAQGFADVHPGSGPDGAFVLDGRRPPGADPSPDPLADGATAWRWMHRAIRAAPADAGVAGPAAPFGGAAGVPRGGA